MARYYGAREASRATERNPTERMMINALMMHGPLIVTELADKVGCSVSTAKNYMVNLKAEGLVELVDGKRWRFLDGQ